MARGTRDEIAVRLVLWKMISRGLRFIQIVEGGPGDRRRKLFTSSIPASGEKPCACQLL